VRAVLPQKNSILSTAYFPPIDYFYAIVNSNKAYIEYHENYQKQSYRSRCEIFGAQGVETLIVPIIKSSDKKISKIMIDYSTSWIHQHKMAIISAYGNSPFLVHYQDEIFQIIDSKPKYLWELNNVLLTKIIELLGTNSIVDKTEKFKKEYLDDLDLRRLINPKKPNIYKQKPYYQVFSDKYGYINNLSILDLLFNEGPSSESFLRI